MDFYDQSYSFPYHNGAYYNQIPYESEYYDQSLYSHSYYPPTQPSANFYSYEFQPPQSLIAYSPCHEVGYEDNTYPIQYSVYHSVAPPPPLDGDLEFPDYDPHPYKGGYDIDQTYGKALPPNDQICYTPTSFSPSTPAPLPIVPVPQEQKQEEEEEEDDDDEEEDDDDEEEDDEVEDEEEELPVKEEAKDLRIEAPAPEEEEESDDEESIGSDEESDGSEDPVEVNEVVKEGNYVEQMPAGYGLEAYDLCENLFGYWPCLSKMKMKKKCGECGSEITVNGGERDVDEWKMAADYFFGNPNPYKASMESSGYGYHQMQYQYQPSSALVMYEQPYHQYGQNSWTP